MYECWYDNILCLSWYSRKGDLGALDKNDLTPILTAAAYKNDDAFNTMVEKGGDSLKSTLFQAAKKPDTSNIQALEVPLWNYVIFHYFAADLSYISFFPQPQPQQMFTSV